jgi:dihydrofolate reductase
MTTYVYVATSLDGYIADKNGRVDWLNEIPNPENSDFGFAEFMDKIDAVVMGRNTFEQVLTFGTWPYNKPVYVISTTLSQLPDEYAGKAYLLSLKPLEIIEYLKKEGMENLYIDGGALIQSFLSTDLIDEFIITSVPVLLGGGIPLFGKLSNRFKLDHLNTEVLNNYLVRSHYRRQR